MSTMTASPSTQFDTAAIMGAVQEAGPQWSALDVLPAARARLRPHLVPDAIRAADPVWLPDALEKAFAAGYSDADPDRWQLPRPQAADLAQRLTDWYATERPAGAVVVRDPRLRPYFWRLLNGLTSGPVWVLAEGEIDER